MSYCTGPPDRIDNRESGNCGNYITHRPHLSMHAYRDSAAPLYTQSNPAKYSQQFKSNNDNRGNIPAYTLAYHNQNTLLLQNPQVTNAMWGYSSPSNVPHNCNCSCNH